MLYPFTIKPNTYVAFETEDDQIEKCKEWGLLSGKASKSKAFFYKGNGMNLPCSIVGYVDKVTAVIEFDNKELHCIHPSYLKEMQAANYSQKLAAVAEESGESENQVVETAQETPSVVESVVVESKPKESPKAKTKTTNEKAPKLELPEQKVKMTAIVQEFTTVPNHFSDTDDEVVIYEAVSITDPETEIGLAWSSHSATLKKFELEVGDKITFEGKIVAKKLTKHPIPYKINNPGKIQKEQ